MRLNLLSISRATAGVGFLALFPGYLLYHYSLAQGWIQPFLGGLFGNVSLMMGALCLLLLPWILSRSWRGAFIPGVLVAGLVAYMTLWTVGNFVFIRGEAYAADAMRESVSAIVIWLAMLFVGGFYPFDRPRLRTLLAIFAGLIVVAFAHAVVQYASPVGPYLTFVARSTDTVHSGYLGIGRSILVSAIFLGAVLIKTHLRLAVFAVGSLLLLLLGSRSDLFAMISLTAVLALVSGASGKNRWSSIAAMGGCCVLLYFASPLFFATRSTEVLDLDTSSSWQVRQELQAAALRVIRENPIFGEFGYHIRDGGAGFYAHNALSAWTNFGLVGFLLFIGLMAYFTVLSFRRMGSGQTADAAWFAAFQLNLASLIQAIAASPIFFPLPALAWGVTLNALRASRGKSRGGPPAIQRSLPPTLPGLTTSIEPFGSVSQATR